LKCAWSCGNSKLGSGRQQHSNNPSSMMYGSALGFTCYIHEARKKSGRELQDSVSVHCLLFSKQLFDSFLLDKSNILNDVPENDDFVCSNPVCRLWIPYRSPYSLQVTLNKVVIFLSWVNHEDTLLFNSFSCNSCPSTSVAEYNICCIGLCPTSRSNVTQ
jgi:hypothetical protein